MKTLGLSIRLECLRLVNSPNGGNVTVLQNIAPIQHKKYTADQYLQRRKTN